MAEPRAPVESGGHELDAPRLRGIAIGGGAILAIVLIAVLVALFIVRGSTPPVARSGVATAPSPALEVRLQAAPGADIAAFRRDKARLLTEYAWVDRTHGVVRIPIEQAMALLVQDRAGHGASR